MDTWLIIVLAVIGVLTVLGGFLIYKGKTDVVKKIFLPIIGVLGLGAAAGTVLGKGSKDIREENKRIKKELKEIETKQDDLRETVKEETERHEERVEDLQEKIDAKDEQAEALKEDIEKQKEQGPREWYDGLSEEEKKRIQDEHKLSDVPDKYMNPPDSTEG